MGSVTGAGGESFIQHTYNSGPPKKTGKTESNISRLTTGKTPIDVTSPNYLKGISTTFVGKGKEIKSKTDGAGFISGDVSKFKMFTDGILGAQRKL